MRRKTYPILEFDPATRAVIEPHRLLQPAGHPRERLLARC